MIFRYRDIAKVKNERAQYQYHCLAQFSFNEITNSHFRCIFLAPEHTNPLNKFGHGFTILKK